MINIIFIIFIIILLLNVSGLTQHLCPYMFGTYPSFLACLKLPVSCPAPGIPSQHRHMSLPRPPSEKCDLSADPDPDLKGHVSMVATYSTVRKPDTVEFR